MKIDTSLMFDPTVVGDMACELEQVGFDGAYAFEGQNDPFVSLTCAAMKTQKMDLMTSIAVAFARNPMSLAYLANDLQIVSKGRFILGLGTQVKAHIERRFGMPWSKPAARMKEMVEAIRAIWHSWDSGERLRFEGQFYSHTLMNPTFTPPAHAFARPDVYIAGVGPLMTQVAAEVGDGYFVHPFHSQKSFQELSRPAIDKGLNNAEKKRENFAVSAQIITASGVDDASLQAAIGSARNQIAFYGSTPAYQPILDVHGWGHMQEKWHAMTRAGEWLEMSKSVTDEMLETFAVIGSPEVVAAKIKDRSAGEFDRISPVIYEPNIELLTKLLAALKSEVD